MIDLYYWKYETQVEHGDKWNQIVRSQTYFHINIITAVSISVVSKKYYLN